MSVKLWEIADPLPNQLYHSHIRKKSPIHLFQAQIRAEPQPRHSRITATL